MTNLKSFVLLAATVAASLGAAGLASAADAPNTLVQFKPEDLNSEAGVQKVYRQIRAAAENACTSVSTGTHLVTERAESCRKAAIANAVEALHNKRLAEVASMSKSG